MPGTTTGTGIVLRHRGESRRTRALLPALEIQSVVQGQRQPALRLGQRTETRHTGSGLPNFQNLDQAFADPPAFAFVKAARLWHFVVVRKVFECAEGFDQRRERVLLLVRQLALRESGFVGMTRGMGWLVALRAVENEQELGIGQHRCA